VSKNNTRTYEQALSQVSAWFSQKDWTVFDFQKECWQAVSQGHDGLLHAPTGSGKTHALWMPHILRWLQNPEDSDRGLQLVWITPLKALAKDMERQFQQTILDFILFYCVNGKAKHPTVTLVLNILATLIHHQEVGIFLVNVLSHISSSSIRMCKIPICYKIFECSGYFYC